MKLDGIILDIDGTIWNTTEIVADAWNLAIKKSNSPVKKVTAKILEKEFGKTMEVICQDLWPNLNDKQKKELLHHCCIEEHLAINQNTKDITYSKVIETIKELSKTQKFYIVSNCQNGYIELTMEKTGITKFIKDFECFGNTNKSKGENLILLKNRNNLQNVIYIGDTQGDCDACRFANIPFVWASYGFGNPTEYFAKLDSFDELVLILQKNFN